MNPGHLRHYVALDQPLDNGAAVSLQPSRVWAAIRPVPPGAFDEVKTTHLVEIRYHEQVTFNTRITHQGRYLYVRGIQDFEERHRDMVLLCEEVLPR